MFVLGYIRMLYADRESTSRKSGFVLGESDIKRQPVALSALCRLGRIGSSR
jgi:hypothetical protein